MWNKLRFLPSIYVVYCLVFTRAGLPYILVISNKVSTRYQLCFSLIANLCKYYSEIRIYWLLGLQINLISVNFKRIFWFTTRKFICKTQRWKTYIKFVSVLFYASSAISLVLLQFVSYLPLMGILLVTTFLNVPCTCLLFMYAVETYSTQHRWVLRVLLDTVRTLYVSNF